MENLLVLHFQGNPVIKKIKQYRRNMIFKCKKLTYLDDKPIKPMDRRCAEVY